MPPRDDSFKEFIFDQLADLPGLDAKYMFGGWGFYLSGAIFGLVADGSFFLKADDALKAELKELGSAGPFEYAPGKLMNGYWEAPLSIIEDRRAFERWARRSALLSSSKPPKKPKAKKAENAPVQVETKKPKPASKAEPEAPKTKAKARKTPKVSATAKTKGATSKKAGAKKTEPQARRKP